MGREIRMVPPNWEHPKGERKHGGVDYLPMFDNDSQSAWEEWLGEYQDWLGGKFAEIQAKYPSEYDPNEPYAGFCRWHGDPPDPEYYHPKWADGSATWFQVYETVSEGTPVSPPFATKEELVDYLCTHGDFWDQARRREGRGRSMDNGPWKRENAEKFVGRGFAPSMMVQTGPDGTVIKTAKDGI